jgi:hypothetical protein
VSRVLRRAGLSKLRDLEPSEPVVRYEHEHPGDLVHIDTKKLGRIARMGHRVTGDRRDTVEGAGWECLFVAVDDHSRVSFTDLYPDERKERAVAFEQVRKAVSEKTAVIQADIASDEKLTDAEQAVLKIMVDLRDGALNLTAAHRAQLGVAIEGLLAADKELKVRPHAALRRKPRSKRSINGSSRRPNTTHPSPNCAPATCRRRCTTRRSRALSRWK